MSILISVLTLCLAVAGSASGAVHLDTLAARPFDYVNITSVLVGPFAGTRPLGGTHFLQVANGTRLAAEHFSLANGVLSVYCTEPPVYTCEHLTTTVTATAQRVVLMTTSSDVCGTSGVCWSMTVVGGYNQPPARKLRVAALQYMPSSRATPAATVAANADAVAAYIAANLTSRDIVVVPEFALFGNVSMPAACDASVKFTGAGMAAYCFPVPAVGDVVDCTGVNATTADPLKRVACGPAASAYANTTVSINVCERYAPSGVYTTQVALRAGRILAVYRKQHVFFPQCFDTPPLELSTFHTGAARFGVFTCYDMMYTLPKYALVDMGIRFFSYSSALPMAHALVELFSMASNVTVVSSNLQPGQTSIVVGGETLQRCPNEPVTCAAVADVDLD